MPDVEPLLCPYPGWNEWRGVSGLYYARRPNSSPAVVFRSVYRSDVHQKIETWIANHPELYQEQAKVPPWNEWLDADA